MERKKTSLMILGVCALVLSVIGVTYAFWQLRLSQKESDTISSSCFDVSLINEGKAIQLTKAYPMEDKEGEQLDAYTFTIKNNCEANAKYQINLESLTKLNSGEEVTERLNEKYLKVKLNEEGKEGSIQKLTEENKVEATLIEGQTEGKERSDKAYKLTIGYLEPNEEKKYELRLWLDGNLTTEDVEAMNKTYASKITIVATYAKEAKKTLEETILTLKPETEDSGASGIYKVTHDDAEITYTSDSTIISKLQKDEYRYAGKEPKNYVSFGETYTSDVYSVYMSDTYNFSSQEICNNSRNDYYELELQDLHPSSYELTECIEKQNDNQKYFLGDEKNEEYLYVFDTEEECTNKKSEYESIEYSVGECSSPGIFYTFTYYVRAFSMEYTTEEECNHSDVMSEESGFICKKSHQAGDPIYWRIIGLVNTPEGQRVKLVRDESIGDYSWDISDMDINNGEGVNEWSDSDIMKLLNPGYETSLPGKGSLYWNRVFGQCATYNLISGIAEWRDCNFSFNGMDESLKSMIEEITWNTGSNGDKNEENINVNEFYNLERSSNTGDICKEDKGGRGGDYCNDTIERTTSWKGKVGLIYPSDYGYAVGGRDRETCLTTGLGDYDNYDVECYGNNWLIYKYLTSPTFTISAAALSEVDTSVFAVMTTIAAESGGLSHAIQPSVYLKPNVIVSQGDGSPENPYVLEV